MRRRQAPAPVAVAASGIPEQLRAGRCLEVWAADVREAGARPEDASSRPGRVHVAWRRWSYARDLHAADSGADPGNWHTWPAELRRLRPVVWSFAELQQENPERLALVLAGRGLPLDWSPVPPPPEYLARVDAAIRTATGRHR